MTSFPEPPSDDYAMIYLENTDKELPEKLNPSMRYAYFKTIAKGGKAVIQSCKDLYLSRVVCYKKLRILNLSADRQAQNYRFEISPQPPLPPGSLCRNCCWSF